MVVGLQSQFSPFSASWVLYLNFSSVCKSESLVIESDVPTLRGNDESLIAIPYHDKNVEIDGPVFAFYIPSECLFYMTFFEDSHLQTCRLIGPLSFALAKVSLPDDNSATITFMRLSDTLSLLCGLDSYSKIRDAHYYKSLQIFRPRGIAQNEHSRVVYLLLRDVGYGNTRSTDVVSPEVDTFMEASRLG